MSKTYQISYVAQSKAIRRVLVQNVTESQAWIIARQLGGVLVAQ